MVVDPVVDLTKSKKFYSTNNKCADTDKGTCPVDWTRLTGQEAGPVNYELIFGRFSLVEVIPFQWLFQFLFLLHFNMCRFQ